MSYGFNRDGYEEWKRHLDEGEEWKRPKEQQRLITKVSPRVNSLIVDLQSASRAFAALPGTASREMIDSAYSYLNMCRKDLYTYVAELEERAKVKRTINLRF